MLMCGAWQLKYDWKTIKEGFFKTINVVYVKCQYFIEKAYPCVVKTDTKNKTIILYMNYDSVKSNYLSYESTLNEGY